MSVIHWGWEFKVLKTIFRENLADSQKYCMYHQVKPVKTLYGISLNHLLSHSVSRGIRREQLKNWNLKLIRRLERIKSWKLNTYLEFKMIYGRGTAQPSASFFCSLFLFFSYIMELRELNSHFSHKVELILFLKKSWVCSLLN